MKKSTAIKILIVSNLVLMLIIIVMAVVWVISSVNKTLSEPDTKSEEIKANFHTEQHTLANGENVTVENEEYNVRPGYTYFLDKGNMKLYADITPSVDGKILTVSGCEYHMDKLMSDASINAKFVLDLSSGTYNTAENISITHYDGMNATFEDHRNVALKFDGTLSMITDGIPQGATPLSTNIATAISGNEESVNINSPVSGIVVDEYSDGASQSESLDTICTPANEKKTVYITAKFIESATCSGTKYVDIKSGKEFYTFGAKFPYNSNECNTVTIKAVYRGNEKKFNGLTMDDTYPCFVTSSIRKPTKGEVE